MHLYLDYVTAAKHKNRRHGHLSNVPASSVLHELDREHYKSHSYMPWLALLELPASRLISCFAQTVICFVVSEAIMGADLMGFGIKTDIHLHILADRVAPAQSRVTRITVTEMTMWNFVLQTDKASMLDEIIDYVKFLQLQVKVLSMSRLGGASAVAPLVANMSSESNGNGNATSSSGNGEAANGSSNGDNNGGGTLRVTEQQVAKLMEEDMGSAMQYLQGKGLCLMPISLATAISSATSSSLLPRTGGGAGGSLHEGGNGTSPPLVNGTATGCDDAGGKQ
ncbi:Os02g0795800 [Oryza sativa Japonica Group]|uniref:Os02g0795800 protein n=1 Tax=Oryza sativa subsp. japonica TaxID=39947 RepID=A0A0P0VQL9_ORYSJ|nr:hypothetical protein EE612_014219 [Oryza sativa]BAS81359.1 Os02g0795800 [Oryza sativa Japonica Group]